MRLPKLPQIESAHFLLRALHLSDAAELWEMLHTNTIRTDLPLMQDGLNATTLLRVMQLHQQHGNSLYWAVVPPSEQVLAGLVGLADFTESGSQATLHFVWQDHLWLEDVLQQVLEMLLKIGFWQLKLQIVLCQPMQPHPLLTMVLPRLGFRQTSVQAWRLDHVDFQKHAATLGDDNLTDGVSVPVPK